MGGVCRWWCQARLRYIAATTSIDINDIRTWELHVRFTWPSYSYRDTVNSITVYYMAYMNFWIAELVIARFCQPPTCYWMLLDLRYIAATTSIDINDIRTWALHVRFTWPSYSYRDTVNSIAVYYMAYMNFWIAELRCAKLWASVPVAESVDATTATKCTHRRARTHTHMQYTAIMEG